MKKVLLSIGMTLLLVSTGFGQNLIITGVFDGPLSGGTPKGVELYATAAIADLSVYAVGFANNGGGTDGDEITLSGSASAGDFIYIASEATNFNSWFGFSAGFTTGNAGINGDDAIELFFDSGADGFTAGDVVDVFGDINTDGSGQPWEYLDGWAYRKSFTSIDGTTFDLSNWFFSSPNALDGETTNATATTPFPTGAFDNSPLNTAVSGNEGWRLLSLPITGGTVADVSDDTPVQGITGGSNAGSDSNFKIYDNTGSFEDPTNTSTAWGNGYGFALYFYNNTTAGSSTLPVTLDASGSEPASAVDVTLNGGAANQFTLVGNPFASNYNTNSISATGGSISNNISFWNDGTSSYSAQDRTASGGYIAAPWQGFWVETSDASVTSITFATSGKDSSQTTGTFFSKVLGQRGDISFTLSSENSYDEAIRLSFRDYATKDFDIADASKLNPLATTYATMAFLSNDRLKAVESLPYNLEETVELKLEEQLVGVSGEFTLDWSGLETIPADWTLTFHDYDEGTSVDMREVSEYTFTAEADDKAKVNPLSILSGVAAETMKSKSSDNTRFGITLQPNTAVSNEPGETPLSFGLEQNYPNPFNPSTTIAYSIAKSGQVSLSVYNLMGQKVAELVNEVKGEGSYNVSWNAAGAASGMYYYRLEAAGQTLTRKMTLIK